MRKIVIIFLISIQYISAQESSIDFKSDFGIFNTAFNSKTIINSLGFWDNNHKEHLTEQLSDINHVYLQGNTSLKFEHKKGWSIGFMHHVLAPSTYSKDLFRLGIFGNKPLAGEILEMDPTQLNYYQFSEIETGFKLKQNFKVTTSFIIGHELAIFNISKANLMTSNNDEFIDYELILEGHYTDRENSTSLNPNGYGGAIGIYYEKQNNGNRLSLSANHIGFIIWNHNSNNIHIDTAAYFQGIEINNLLDIQDQDIQDQINKIENNFNVNKEKYTWRLPVEFSAVYYHNLNKWNIQGLSIGLKHLLDIYSSPLIYANLHKEKNKNKWTIGYHIGGLEKPGFQFSYSRQAKTTELRLFTRQANLFLQEEIYGLHIGISIKKVFLNKQ